MHLVFREPTPAVEDGRTSEGVFGVQLAAGVSVRRGVSFLEQAFDTGYDCRLSSTVTFEQSYPAPAELFSTILAMEVAPALLSRQWYAAAAAHLRAHRTRSGWVHFFEDPSLLPADVDCTALLTSTLFQQGVLSLPELHSVLDAIVANVNDSGVIQVYQAGHPGREGVVDAAVAANALYAISLGGRANEAVATQRLVLSALTELTFLGGTRYYQCPDTFLFFVSRLLATFPEQYGDWRDPLRRALSLRDGYQQHCLDEAQWLAAVDLAGVPLAAARSRRSRLRGLQLGDGSWPAEGLFKYGRKRVYFGSRALTTAFTLRALAVDLSKPLACLAS